jgi:hypothetical protein
MSCNASSNNDKRNQGVPSYDDNYSFIDCHATQALFSSATTNSTCTHGCLQIVRETLCSMQLPYKHVSCARGSPKREELMRKYGSFQVMLLWCSATEAKSCVFLFHKHLKHGLLRGTLLFKPTISQITFALVSAGQCRHQVECLRSS